MQFLSFFESDNLTHCWDGNFKGRDASHTLSTSLNTDVFVYIFDAELSNGEKFEQKGNLSVIEYFFTVKSF